MKIPELLKSNMRGSPISLRIECKVLLRHGFGTALQHPHHHLSPVFKQQTNKKDVAITTAAGIRHDFWGFRYYAICNKLCGTDFVVTHLNILLFTNTCHKAMYLYSPLR